MDSLFNSLDIAIDFLKGQGEFKNPDYSRKEFTANNSTRSNLHKEQEEGFSRGLAISLSGEAEVSCRK